MTMLRRLRALPLLLALTLALAACGGNAGTTTGATTAPAVEATTGTTSAATTAATTEAPAATTAATTEATTAATTAATTEATTAATTEATTAATTEATTAATAATTGGATTGMTPAQVDALDLTGKNVEVVYWHNRPQADQDLIQSMLDEFNKTNPYGIKARAEIAGASYNDVYTKVSAAIQAGQPPDMSVAYQNQAAFYRAQNAVIDLAPFINSPKYGLSADDQKDFFQPFLSGDANPQFGGERLGFPTQRSMEVLFYNADALKALGYDGPPKDWKTFEEAACKFSDAANNKFGWAFRHDASNFATMVFANGGQILADDGKSYVFNSQAGQDSLAMIQRLFAKKCAVEIPTSERFGEQNRFANGQVLFVLASSSGLPFYADAVTKGAKFKWDIALPPNSGTPATNLYGASVSVYKTTPEKELASWLVLKFLSEKAQTTKWAAATGYLPVRQSAKDDVIAAFKANPKYGPVADSYAKMFDWIQYGKVESPVAGYDPVRKLIDEQAMTPVLTDANADVKSILDDVVQQSNAVLTENEPKP